MSASSECIAGFQGSKNGQIPGHPRLKPSEGPSDPFFPHFPHMYEPMSVHFFWFPIWIAVENPHLQQGS